MIDVRIEVPNEVLEAIASRAAAIVLDRIGIVESASPYLSVAEAAEYARCSKHRIYDLLSSGRLRRYKDGRRVLVLRDELAAYLSGVTTPLPGGHSRQSRSGVAR